MTSRCRVKLVLISCPRATARTGSLRCDPPLPTEGLASAASELDRLACCLADRYQIGPEFNVLKFRSDELKVSFLLYPRSFQDPHPSLRQAVTVDLVRGKARHTDYAGNPNPPILHRKEAFLPADHPKRRLFAALTQAEEAAGLYADTTTIGFKLNWDQLLASKGLRYRGHRLLEVGIGAEAVPGSRPSLGAPSPVERVGQAFQPAGSPDFAVRHLTGRLESRPDRQTGMSALLTEAGPRTADSGTRGDCAPPIERHKRVLVRYELSKPVRTLLEYGQLRPGVTFFDYGCGQGGDVTGLRNLGYAADGWDLVHRPDGGKTEADVVNLGYVLNVIEDPAERLATLVDAFRHTRRLLVVSALIRETVDTETAATFGDGVLTKRNTFQKYFDQPELQQYVEDALETTVVPVSLGIFYVFRDPVAQQDFIETRRNDLLVYMALSNLRKRVPFGHLSASLRLDIRTFFGNHNAALAKGLDLLYAAGDPGEIELACEGLNLGWQDEQALYVHRNLLDRLPPVLRARVGCATALFGDVQQADVIKLHKATRPAARSRSCPTTISRVSPSPNCAPAPRRTSKIAGCRCSITVD